ncbi:MAG: protein-glutamate O-methyltransferase CheR [Deltaproteobacteria bacterium]|nr:protein-glutamate O-methyltransferase CheR [Deltaproteobacteria bacterium]
MDTLSSPLFAIFASLIEATCGLHYDVHDRELFGTKLAAHAMEHGHDTFLDYYYRLRYDDPDHVELQLLVESLLVHETYFFRELPPLIQLVETHLAPIIQQHGRARVWSTACSTGEEPYSLAMLLDTRGLLDDVEIVATDISGSVVERARSGRHGRRSLRDGHPSDLAKRYLEVTPQGVAVTRRIRDAVRFSTLNLVLPDAGTELGVFDAILCRNVLIYFKDDQVVRVIDKLTDRLEAEGLLVVGVSESLLRFGTGLTCEERGNAFFYRRAR